MSDIFESFPRRWGQNEPLTKEEILRTLRFLRAMERVVTTFVLPPSVFFACIYEDDVPDSGCRDGYGALRQFRRNRVYRKWMSDGQPVTPEMAARAERRAGFRVEIHRERRP